jgi:hypothetical protein
MAGSTLPAEARRRRIALALVLVGLSLAGCALFERTEPRASREVMDAIYDGMRRAHEPAPPTS